MLRKANNVLELVGQTPIVRLNRLNPHPQVEIYVKLEYFNPGGSVKDRICLSMIEAAEKAGQLADAHPAARQAGRAIKNYLDGINATLDVDGDDAEVRIRNRGVR